jgi:hypothetical protein
MSACDYRRDSSETRFGWYNTRFQMPKHPRCYLHFTPTSSSWLNLVERWFADEILETLAAYCGLITGSGH